jgi:hypothetical protein
LASNHVPTDSASLIARITGIQQPKNLKKNEAESIKHPDFEICSKMIIIKIALNWHKD